MKRKRKCIRFHLLPLEGRFQVIFLSTEGLVSPWRIGLDTDPPPFLGPFLFNLDSQRIIHFDVVNRCVDLFEQSEPVVGNETNFLHYCSFGDLYESQYTRYIEFAKEHKSWLFGPVDFSTRANRMLSYDDDGSTVDYVRVFEFGHDTEIDHLYDPVLMLDKDYVQRWYDNGNMYRFVVGAPGDWHDFSWTTDTQLSGLSNHVGIYRFERLDITFDSSGPKALLPTFIEALDGGRHRLWRYEFMHKAKILPVSPVITIQDSVGTNRDARLETVCEFVRQQLSELGSKNDDDAEFRSALSAVEGLKACDINGLAFIKDLQEIKNFLEPAIKIFKNPLVLKNWISVALWWKYGVKLSIADSKEIIHVLTSIKKAHKSLRQYMEFKNSTKCRYGSYYQPPPNINGFESTGSVRCNTRIVVRPAVEAGVNNPLNAISALLDDLDVKISMEHIWDFVPYSFVVDWFINIGDLLNQFETMLTVNHYRLRERIYSRNARIVVDPAAYLPYGYSGYVVLSTYDRYVSQMFPLPPFGLALTDAFKNHIFEGTLLTLQRV